MIILKDNTMTHRVHKHHWRDGKLHQTRHFFRTLEEALAFSAIDSDASIKIYEDNSGQLVHSSDPQPTNTYA
jgi:hypothetical protein